MKETLKRQIVQHWKVITLMGIAFIILGIFLTVRNQFYRYNVTLEFVEIKEEEGELASYLEGRNLAELQEIVLFKKVLGDISEADADKAMASIYKAFDNFSLKSLKRTYQVIANVLKEDLYFEHHEKIDKESFISGYMNRTVLTSMFSFSLMGEVSEEDYQMLEKMETDIASSYSNEKSVEFINKVTEILKKSFDTPDIMEQMPFLPREMVGI